MSAPADRVRLRFECLAWRLLVVISASRVIVVLESQGLLLSSRLLVEGI
jgi:hypothetical protein